MNPRFKLMINDKEYIGLLTFRQDDKNYLVYTDSIDDDPIRVYAGTFEHSFDNSLDIKPVNDSELDIVKNKINDLAMFLG